MLLFIGQRPPFTGSVIILTTSETHTEPLDPRVRLRAPQAPQVLRRCRRELLTLKSLALHFYKSVISRSASRGQGDEIGQRCYGVNGKLRGCSNTLLSSAGVSSAARGGCGRRTLRLICPRASVSYGYTLRSQRSRASLFHV